LRPSNAENRLSNTIARPTSGSRYLSAVFYARLPTVLFFGGPGDLRLREFHRAAELAMKQGVIVISGSRTNGESRKILVNGQKVGGGYGNF
jgi:hypothetical protein